MAQIHYQFALSGFDADFVSLRFMILQFTLRHLLDDDARKDEAKAFERFRQPFSDFETEISQAMGHTAR